MSESAGANYRAWRIAPDLGIDRASDEGGSQMTRLATEIQAAEQQATRAAFKEAAEWCKVQRFGEPILVWEFCLKATAHFEEQSK